MERRLAAILAADVVGYSRLMGADEEATLATLNTYREVHRQATTRWLVIVVAAGEHRLNNRRKTSITVLF